MATADDVFAAVVAALDITEVRLATPGDLPTPAGAYPILKVRLESESKQSQGRGSIGFTALVTVRIVGEVSEPVSVDDDIAISGVVAKLNALKALVERAVINRYPLFGFVQQLASVVTQYAYTAQDTRLAGIQSDYTFEIYQSAEDFFQLPVDDLDEIVATDPHHFGAGLTAATT